MLNVLVGSNDDDFHTLVDAARDGKNVVGWVVPKKAAVGDRVLLCTPSRGFVADALVASEKEPGEFGQRHVFRADVGPVKLFPSPIPIAYIVTVMPERPWPTYPRSYTTPPEPIAEALLAAIRAFEIDLGPVDADSTETFSEGKVHQPGDRVSIRARQLVESPITYAHCSAQLENMGYDSWLRCGFFSKSRLEFTPPLPYYPRRSFL
ncbi:MAG: hypothetical protein GXY83_03535 [Rhodopirellula sp.]|nr:hypothetical protein [Rhodopirellula sp.]